MFNKVQHDTTPRFQLMTHGVVFMLLLTTGITHPLSAQQPLTLSTALETTLKNNYSILISRNELGIAENNNTIGNAGMLPRLDVSAGISNANVNTHQEYSNGNIVKQDGASTDGMVAGAHFSWTLFDGLKMFATRSRLGVQEDVAGIQLKLQIENTVTAVIENYFLAVNILQQIKVLDDAIAIYEVRMRLADMRLQVGSGSRLELLQSQVDRNARKSERLQLLVAYDNTMAQLRRMMGTEDTGTYQLTDSIVLNYNPEVNEILKSVPNNNHELQLVKKQELVYKNIVKETRSLRYPVLDLNVDYNYSRTENEVGFVLLNQNQGLYSGLTLSWNLFNGFNTNREIKNAKLNLNSTALLLSDTRAKINQDLYVAIKKFQSDREILDLESQNAVVATENVNIALEAFRLGSISGLQLKDAQNSYEVALSRLANARYQAKLSETVLMKLNGELVK